MKATVEMSGGRYEIWGLTTPSVNPINEMVTDGKPVYELTYLYTFARKSYKTIENAVKAIRKRGLEYVPADGIITVCGWD